MTAAPYSHMARQFMELWQKQLTSVLGDREFAQAMCEMMQAMSMPYDPDQFSPTAAAAASASPVLLERLEQLEYRLRGVERRLAALEAEREQSQGRQGSAAGGAGKSDKPGGAKPRK